MKTFRASMMVAVFGLFASIAACGGEAPTDGTATTTNAIATTVDSHGSRLGHGRRMHGPASLLFAALRAPLNLSADQTATIKQALQTLKPNREGHDGAERRAALAAAVRSGNIDLASLGLGKPATADRVERKAALAKALATLHATLTPEQRAALVAEVGKRGEGFKHGAKKGLKAEGKHGRGFGPMRMLKGLDLTQEQNDAIRAQFEARKPAPMAKADREAMKVKWQAMRQERKARLQAFTSDAFDATAFLAHKADMPAKIKGRGNKLAQLAVIVPILTPAQREVLAAKIEKGRHSKAQVH